jgi:hypothetical protein
MTVSEVAIALEQYTNDRRTRDPSYQPNLLVSKTIEYTNTISTNKNLDTVRKIRNLLAEAGMTETELALVVCVRSATRSFARLLGPRSFAHDPHRSLCSCLQANLALQTAEEAKQLIPSLADRFSDDALNRILLEVQNYAEFE